MDNSIAIGHVIRIIPNNIVSSPEQPRKRTKVLRLLFLYPFLHKIQRS